jgi:glycosyltransferase involved in cell wall biosynthesis
MRILIVTQYFWPENFKINDIALALKERGHEVLILTGKPNYPNGKFSKGYTFFNNRIEFWNGIKIYRSPIIPRGKGKGIQLFVNYISFSIFASIKLLFIKNKFDKIFVYEPSPITVGIPGIVAKYKFRAPLYFWVQDLWPESISAAGGINNKSVIAVLDWLTRFIYKQSKKVLVQSKAFIPYILNQSTEKNKLVYYPNSTENYYKEMSTDQELLKTLPKGIKLMFAGNIGEAQSFDTLLKAASILKKELIDVKWIILGDGRMKGYVNQKIKEFNLEDNFYLLGAFPSTEMPKYFSCADALIVSLKKDPIFALTIPSKIQSYLACGKPIITSLDGEGSKIIEEANAGFTSPSEDYMSLVANIKKFLTLSKEEQKVLGQNGRTYFNLEFEREILVDKLEEIFNND